MAIEFLGETILLPALDAGESYGEQSYWDAAYTASGAAPFDWLEDWEDVARLLLQALDVDAPLLEIGCGTSALPRRLQQAGFQQVTAVDFSRVAIEAMQRQAPDIDWRVMDVRDMSAFADGAFGGVVDKGTLDAVRCGGSDSAEDEALREVARVLAPGGAFVMVSMSGPEQHAAVTRAPEYGWRVEAARHVGEGRTHWFMVFRSGSSDSGSSEDSSGEEEDGEFVFFDWYCEFEALREVLRPPDVHGLALVLANGASALPRELAAAFGERLAGVVAVDCDERVVEQLREADESGAVRYSVADMRELAGVPDASAALVVDKGGLDALVCGDDPVAEVERVVRAVARVLLPGGAFVVVSNLSQPCHERPLRAGFASVGVRRDVVEGLVVYRCV